jgi:transcription antitermination factor NusG
MLAFGEGVDSGGSVVSYSAPRLTRRRGAMQWFVVESNASSERTAAELLKPYNPFLPVYQREIRHARRTMFRESVLFPSYLFINVDMDTEVHSTVCRTRGVRGVLGRPTPLADDVVSLIRHQCVDTNDEIKAGERVSVGVFTGLFEGREGDRVRVLISLLGREVTMTYRPWEIKRCASQMT